MPTPPSDSVAFWLQLVGQVGFPIIVAGYLLVRVVPAIDRLTRAIDHLVRFIVTHQVNQNPNQPPRRPPAHRRAPRHR